MDNSELRRQLELAAKAVGAKIEWRTILGNEVLRADFGEGFEPWAPHDNDGDSRRLEVAIGATVSQQLSYVCVTLPHGPTAIKGIAWTEPHNDNPAEATRLAVLRVAAAIGEAIP